MTTIKIPDSKEEAVEQLGAAGRDIHRLTNLLNARQWERAALIACLVGPPLGHGPGRGRGKAVELQAFPYSITGLADLGIYGLRSNSTISKYRNIWCQERPIPDFGDEVELDGLPEWTGNVRPNVAGVTSVRSNTPSTEPEPMDTEAVATRMAVEAGTDRITGSLSLVEPESDDEPQTNDVTVRVNNADGAHIDIGIAADRLESAVRKRDEDYPTFNAYHKFGVRGALTRALAAIDKLWPDINEAEEAVMQKRKESGS